MIGQVKEIYRKTSIVSFISGVGGILFCVFYYFFLYESFADDGEFFIQFGTGAIFAIGGGFYFRSAYEKLEDHREEVSELNVDNIHELNIQWVPSPFRKMYNVNSDGEPLMKIEQSKGHMLTKWLLFFDVFANGFLIPTTYNITDMDGKLFGIIEMKTNVKRHKLTLKRPDGKVIGYFIQDFLKSAIKNKGVLYYANDTVWRELNAKNISGDLDVKDEEGLITASYRYGMFPHALNKAFESTSLNHHVRLSSHISKDEKLAYSMIFFLWLRG